MSSPLLSRCGLFVAVVKGDSVQVHLLLQTGAVPAFTSLREVFATHRRRQGTAPLPDVPIMVHQIEWEHILPGHPSLKYAVSASCAGTNLVVAVEVSAPEDPAVLEGDALGIDHLEWFPAIARQAPGASTETLGPPGRSAPAVGAYSNSTMLAVFSRFGLHMKVFSLLSTQVLVTVAKPCSRVMVHPDKPCLWSVVAQPYVAKRLASWRSSDITPRLSHFYTDGVTCTRLASLELASGAGGAAELKWSQSGKWLLLLDQESRLAAPDVHVYNLYGIHQRGSVAAARETRSHVAHPTLTVSGGDGDAFGTLWGLTARGGTRGWDYIVKYRETFDLGRATSIATQMADIASLSQGKPQELRLSEGVIWSHFRDLDMEIKYSRLSRLPPAKFRWCRGVSFGASHVIASDKNVCIFLRQASCPPLLAPDLCVFGDLKFLDVYEVDACFVVAYSDHVLVLHAGAPQILATSRYSFTNVSFSTDAANLAVSLVEDTPGGPLWRRVLRPLSTLKSKSLPLSDETLFAEHEVTDTFQNKRR